MLTIKKVLKGGVILTLLTAVAGLASCTDVEASLTPKEEEAPLLNLEGIDNNTMQQIYDATVTSGDSNSEKVLNNVLLILAKNQLGSFYDVVGDDGKVSEKGLFTLFCATEKDSEGHNVPKPYDSSKDVATLAKNADVVSFLKAHKSAYYGVDVEEDAMTSASKETEEAVKKAIIYTNFLLERINRTFMSYTDDATYCDDSRFFEELFYQHIQKDLWDLEDVKDSEFKGVEDGKSVGVATGESQLSYDANSRYGTDYVTKYFQDNYLEVYEDYINRSLLPNILRKGLVQQYLMDNNYSSFGRSSARNLQYISVSDNSDYPSAIRNLVKAYADLVLNEKLESTYLNAIKDYYNTYSYDLHFLNDLVKGYTEGWNKSLKEAADKVYEAAQFTSITVSGHSAYQETTYGGYLTNYAKITANRFTNDTSVENDFTNSGKYTPEVGLQKKADSLNSKDKTICGWYTDSGLTSLPATYKTRLFKVTVANDLANGEDGIPTYGTWVKDHYYLTRTTYQADDEFPYLIYDEDSSTWYIIRVDEAVKSSRMKKGTETDGTYDHDKGTAYRYDVERQISWILADNSTYTKSANQYYVEQAMVYDHLHDDYVYDYFEETFPDLFD